MRGFTLIEVLVALVIATILVGAATSLMGVAMRNEQRVEKLRDAMPVLRLAADEIFRNPRKIFSSSIVLEDIPESPSVTIVARPVEDPTVGYPLYRVALLYGGERLEFSVIVPQQTALSE